MNKLEPKPTSCVRPGCQLPRQSERRSMTEEDLGEKKRKGRLGQTQGVGGSCAAFNPLGTRGAGKVQLNRQSSQLPNNVPCTDPVSQAIALTPGGWVGNQNSLLSQRLPTGEWVCTQHCAWPLLLCRTTVAAIIGKRWTGCGCLLAGIPASLTTL